MQEYSPRKSMFPSCTSVKISRKGSDETPKVPLHEKAYWGETSRTYVIAEPHNRRHRLESNFPDTIRFGRA